MWPRSRMRMLPTMQRGPRDRIQPLTPSKRLGFEAALPAGFTVARTLTGAGNNGVCYAVNSLGYYSSFAANLPRFDWYWDGVGFSPRNFFAEPAASNICVRSNTFTNAVWTNVATVEAAVTTLVGAVDVFGNASGSLVMFSLKETDTAGLPELHAITKSISLTSGAVYTVSVHACACAAADLGRRKITLLLPIVGFGALLEATFDLVDGTVGGISNDTEASIEMLGTSDGTHNQWYRCCITATATATGAAILSLNINNGATSDNTAHEYTYVGDAAKGVYICQFDCVNSPVPVSPVITAGGSVLRSADAISYSGALPMPQEGTWLITAGLRTCGASATSSLALLTQTAASPVESAQLNGLSKGQYRLKQNAVSDAGSTVIANTVAATMSTGSLYQLALRFRTNDSNAAANGTLGTPDAACALSSTHDTFTVCASLVGCAMWLRSIEFIDGFVSDENLRGLGA